MESGFEKLLKELNVKYWCQYKIGGYRFDFKIRGKKIIIETDGDYWHCNENKGFTPKYAAQRQNIINDLIKNEVARDKGYMLLRFWEHEVHENKEKVKRILLETIKNCV